MKYKWQKSNKYIYTSAVNKFFLLIICSCCSFFSFLTAVVVIIILSQYTHKIHGTIQIDPCRCTIGLQMKKWQLCIIFTDMFNVCSYIIQYVSFRRMNGDIRCAMGDVRCAMWDTSAGAWSKRNSILRNWEWVREFAFNIIYQP